MKIAGWILVIVGVVLGIVAFILNATFASTQFIDDRIGAYTTLTSSGSVVPLVVGGIAAACLLLGGWWVFDASRLDRARKTELAAQPARTIPPGWYPHGNIQRYWDGSAWTDDTAPLA